MHSPLLWWHWLWAAALCGALLPPVPVIGHECFVEGKVFHIGLQDVHDIRLTGNHHQLGEKVTADYKGASSHFHVSKLQYLSIPNRSTNIDLIEL